MLKTTVESIRLFIINHQNNSTIGGSGFETPLDLRSREESSKVCLPPPFFPQRYGNLQTLPSPIAYPTQDRRKSNFPFHVSLSGISFFGWTFTTKVLGLSFDVGASFTSVNTCPSVAFVPFVAISLGFAEVLAGGRENSAPVHVDSSFAVP